MHDVIGFVLYRCTIYINYNNYRCIEKHLNPIGNIGVIFEFLLLSCDDFKIFCVLFDCV